MKFLFCLSNTFKSRFWDYFFLYLNFCLQDHHFRNYYSSVLPVKCKILHKYFKQKWKINMNESLKENKHYIIFLKIGLKKSTITHF